MLSYKSKIRRYQHTNISIMELLNREDHQKLYLQLYEIMRKKIQSNEWVVGSQIPTEEELCKMFNVSRATVRTAVLELARQGYLKRQQGKGTFICKRLLSEGLLMLTSFKETMLEDGLNLSTKVISRTVMPPGNDLARELEISGDKHIMYIKKLFSVDNAPVLLKEIYIPYHICPLLLEEDLENNSLFEIFENPVVTASPASDPVPAAWRRSRAWLFAPRRRRFAACS